MAHKLVIVESPAKARTIGGYLGAGYVVESSIGHIRDLPNNAADTPAKIKDKPWGRLAVDVDNGFEPYYVVPRDKKAHISKLKGLLKDADELYLATDEDREGEAIAWHLLDELKPKAGIPVKRMVFHEITKAAILEAADNPRELDMDLVEAQEARRILDRLYGYEVSPVLWKKVMSGLSAGRVQSVATRLVVAKERERIAFRAASYWDLEGTFDAGASKEPRMFPAKLHSIDGGRVAGGSDFGPDGLLKSKKDERVHLDRTAAEALVAALSDTTFDVRSVEAKPYRRSPYAPFRTTTLQQEASRKLGMSASAAMSVAQRLYENGFITYMRTDSTTLSGGAVGAARAQVRELYGAEYLPDVPRTYASKVKNAQEAHEAIRPAGESFRTPAQTGLTGEQFRLYELIWMRTVASQMKDAVGQSVSVRIGGAAADGRDVVFGASGRVITFHGFLKAYVEGTEGGKRSDDDQVPLPDLARRATASRPPRSAPTATRPSRRPATPRPRSSRSSRTARSGDPRRTPRSSRRSSTAATSTRRAPRWCRPGWRSRSSGCWRSTSRGRSPTSSPPAWRTCSTRSPVVARTAAPSWRSSTTAPTRWRGSSRWSTGSATSTRASWRPSRSACPRTASTSASAATAPTSRAPTTRARRTPCAPTCPTTCRRTSSRSRRPRSCWPTRPARRSSSASTPRAASRSWRRTVATGRTSPRCCPRTRRRTTRHAPARSSSRCRSTRSPWTTRSSCSRCRAWSAPTPSPGDEITAQNGRYGPYLKKGTDSRSLTTEDQLLSITLDEALRIYAQPKQRGRAAAAPPLKELGNDPVSGQPVVVKAGRFGEYVTDGEYNATLRKDDSIEELTLERAAELLAERRAKGPATKKTAKKGAKKAPAKKAAAKKTAAKKTAAKKTTKKAAAKKS